MWIILWDKKKIHMSLTYNELKASKMFRNIFYFISHSRLVCLGAEEWSNDSHQQKTHFFP